MWRQSTWKKKGEAEVEQCGICGRDRKQNSEGTEPFHGKNFADDLDDIKNLRGVRKNFFF